MLTLSIVALLPLLRTRGGAARPGALKHQSSGMIPTGIRHQGRMV